MRRGRGPAAHMRKIRRRFGSSRRRLPESLTQHLSDPKIVILEPRSGGRHSPPMTESKKKVLLSAVTLTIIVLAGGHLLHAW